jgi:LPS export ABC transporter protein LptC
MNSIGHQKLIAFAAGTIMLQCLMVLAACTNDPEEVKAATQNKELPIEWAEDVTIHYSDNGVQKVFMHAPKLERYRQQGEMYTLMPEGVKAIFYDSAATERSSIVAGYGAEYPGKRTVEVKHNVRVINETGDTLFTESLTWDRTRQIIHTITPVRIVTHENEVIYGENGMEADERFTRWRIRNVRESSLIIRESSDEPKFE